MPGVCLVYTGLVMALPGLCHDSGTESGTALGLCYANYSVTVAMRKFEVSCVHVCTYLGLHFVAFDLDPGWRWREKLAPPAR